MKIKGLTIIAIISLLIVIWINLIDFKFVELIEGKGKTFEAIVENLCLSFIAGYMFYFLNVYLVERKEKKDILPFVARNVMLLLVNNSSIISCLKGNSKVDLKKYPTKEEFKVLLEKVNPKENIPFFYINKNWFYLFQNRQKSTNKYIDKILQSGKYIDEDLRRILLEIQSSLYLQEDYAFNSENFSKSNLSEYSLVFENYFDLINSLSKYYYKNLKHYSPYNE
ncbi:hypothetical protein NTJ12_002426 [Flavobacterium psychrophilum]|nr:hypothetical protein [Flavobacterium psychrophilum]